MIYNLALLLPCAVCLIGATWLLCKREGNSHSQSLLIVGFFISAVFFLCTAYYISGSNHAEAFMWWDIVDTFASMFVIPTMYLYFCTMIREGRFTWKEYIWFVPALVVGVGTTWLYMLMDKSEMIGFIQSVYIDEEENSRYSGGIYKLQQFLGVRVYYLTILFQITGVGILAVLRLREYHRRLREFYSDADDKSININNRFLCWCLFAIPLSLALNVPDIKFWQENPMFASLLFVAWAAVYFALFYYGSQQIHTVDNFVQDLQRADFAEKCSCEMVSEESGELNVDEKEVADRQISPEVHQRLVILLTRLIDEEQVYLKSDLRLDEVADLMSTNRLYASKVIKEEYHCSFSDYINLKRINFSMELMRLDPGLTQDKIAEKSGFVNAQSYSRTFKKAIGIPPKKWLNCNIHHP